MRCEFLYRGVDKECPQCGFVSYGARWAIGRECYRLEKTQERWLNRKLDERRQELLKQIGKV